MLKVGYGIRELPPGELLAAGAGMFEHAYAGAGLGPSAQLRLDTQLVELLAKIGHLIALGAFDRDELVGYCALAVGPNLRHKGETQAQLISIYVAPDHRGRGLCEEMLDAAEQVAIDRGIDEVVWLAKRGTSFFNTLHRRCADDRQEVAFVRRLK